jgi:hypothetical protein
VHLQVRGGGTGDELLEGDGQNSRNKANKFVDIFLEFDHKQGISS